jgi:PAS domain S-box-containing protein
MSTFEQQTPSAEHLGSRLEFETLISDTSAALFDARPEQIDIAIERSLERIRIFFQVDRCAVLSVSADQKIVNAPLAVQAEGIERVPADVNLATIFPWSHHRLLVERQLIRVSSIAELPAEAEVEREQWIQMPIRSALSLPIEIRGIVKHIMVLNTTHRNVEWPDHFVTRLRVLGEMLAGALDWQEVSRRLRESEVRAKSGADLAGLGFYEVHFGEGVAYVDSRMRDICGMSPEQRLGLTALEFWIEHLHPDDRQRVLDMREKLHDGRLDKVSFEYRFLHPDQGEKWIEHLAGVARRDAAGHAVATFGVLRDVTNRKRVEDELRDLSQRLIGAHEAERALLARELHDDVTQRLAVLAIDVGRAELAAADRAQTEAMKAVRVELMNLSDDIHSLAYQLHPSVLQELGLNEALKMECERRTRQSGLDILVDIDSTPVVVGKDAALCLYRVTQEALNNVARHAGACTARIALRQKDGGLRLTVNDDGAGFNPEDLGRPRSLGLASMRERVRLVNGTLDIASAPDRGTTIVAWVPAQGSGR